MSVIDGMNRRVSRCAAKRLQAQTRAVADSDATIFGNGSPEMVDGGRVLRPSVTDRRAETADGVRTTFVSAERNKALDNCAGPRHDLTAPERQPGELRHTIRESVQRLRYKLLVAKA